MERLTYRDETGKAYTKIPSGLTFIQEGELIIKAIQKLAHYEDLEDMAIEECKKCKETGHYAEWGDCGECGHTLLLREDEL